MPLSETNLVPAFKLMKETISANLCFKMQYFNERLRTHISLLQKDININIIIQFDHCDIFCL